VLSDLLQCVVLLANGIVDAQVVRFHVNAVGEQVLKCWSRSTSLST
jgi:hypothetical protein